MHPNDRRVLSNFIVQALKGENITLYGDGSQTRSFCYVDDLISGFIKFMNTKDSGNEGKPFTGPINLGNLKEFTIYQLAEKVIAMTGSSSKMVFKPLPADDPLQRQPDIKLAKKHLDWSPNIDLDEGVAKTIAYFDDLLSERI